MSPLVFMATISIASHAEAMRRFEAILEFARLRQRQGAAPRPKLSGEELCPIAMRRKE